MLGVQGAPQMAEANGGPRSQARPLCVLLCCGFPHIQVCTYPEPMNRTRTYWICQLGGWGVLLGVAVADSSHPSLLHAGLSFAGSLATAIGVTHAFRRYVKSAGWTDLPVRQLAPRIVLSAPALAAAFLAIVDLAGLLLYQLTRSLLPSGEALLAAGPPKIDVLSFSAFMGSTLIFGLWVMIYVSVHAYWDRQQAKVDTWRLEAEARSARLQALKTQLNPHFFFNSLNSLRALIAQDPERAQQMVTRLARLLRTTLQASDAKTVPLSEEIQTVRTYLELEKVRFEERLQYRIDVPDTARRRLVPFMLLQTLVENAIKHGVAEAREGGTVTIAADVSDPPEGRRAARDCLRICVTNPGTLAPTPPGSAPGQESGTGLRNARERLHLLFGRQASVTLAQVAPHTVAATALVPTQIASGDTPSPLGAPRSGEPQAPASADLEHVREKLLASSVALQADADGASDSS
jgi:two-component sensor histidine kinase